MFIRGHALVHVFIHGQRVIGRSTYLSCACQSGPYRGWLARRLLIPYSLHPPSGLACVCPLFFFVSQGVFQTPLTFGENLRTPLRTWGFPFRFFMSHVFRRRLRSCWEIFFQCPFHASFWGFLFCLIHQSSKRSLLLFPGWSFPLLSSGGFLRALACPKRFPVFSGIKNYWRDCSAPASDFLVSLLPAFLFHHSVTNKVSWDIFSALQQAYFCGRLSSLFSRWGDN